MEMVVVALLILLIGYLPYKLYMTKFERLNKEAERKEGLYLISIEVLDELSRRRESYGDEQKVHWENLANILMDKVNVIAEKSEANLTPNEASLVRFLNEVKTNKTNQTDVFNRLFDFLIEY
jgi:hypothetical protein